MEAIALQAGHERDQFQEKLRISEQTQSDLHEKLKRMEEAQESLQSRLKDSDEVFVKLAALEEQSLIQESTLKNSEVKAPFYFRSHTLGFLFQPY